MNVRNDDWSALFDAMRQEVGQNLVSGRSSVAPLEWVLAGGRSVPIRQRRAPGLLGHMLAEAHAKPPETSQEMLVSSVYFACMIIEKHLADRGIYLPDLADIPQVADRLTGVSPEAARRSSLFRPERSLRLRRRPGLVGTSHGSVPCCPARGIFQRGGRSCRAAFVEFEPGSQSRG